MSSFDITGNRRRMVTDAMLPSISSNRSQLLKVSSQCMELILNYLQIRSICRLDIAITNPADRIDWLSILRVSHVDAFDKIMDNNKCYDNVMRWLVSRDVRLKSIFALGGKYGYFHEKVLNDVNLLSLLRISLRCNIKEIDFLSLAHGCPNLSEISLLSCNSLRNESIVAFSKMCTKLRSVNISHSDRITDISILAIAYNGPLLSSIKIFACKQITDISLLALAENCPLLSEIEICYCKKITDAGLVAIAQNCPLLINIRICLFTQITDISVIAIAQNCPLLASIDISSCRMITDAGLSAIAQNCPLLNSINFSRCDQITDTGLSAIAQNCPLLNSINISWLNRTSDAGLVAIAQNCLQLTVIDISFWLVSTDAGLSAIAQKCPKLTSISLAFTTMSGTSIGLLNLTRGLPHLSDISIAKCQWLTNADLVAVGRNCNQLTRIDLSNTGIGDEGVVGIANNCPLLSSIRLDYNLRITKVSLIALVEKCPEMKEIKLYNVKGLDEIVSSIRRRHPHIYIQNEMVIESHADSFGGGGC